MVKVVTDQMRDSLALKDCLFSVLTLKATYELDGICNTTRQKTAKKQVEMLFKFILLCWDDVSPGRTSLEIWNSLKLMNANGRNTLVMEIMTMNVVEMTMSYVDITYMVVWSKSNIARRMSSLRLVTNVR